MDRLRTSFEKLGYDDVSTFIASGNVIFKGSGAAKAMEQKIAKHMERELGFSVNVFVRSASALRKAVESTPFTRPKSGETVAVGFMATAPSAAARKATEALSTKQDRFVVTRQGAALARPRGPRSDQRLRQRDHEGARSAVHRAKHQVAPQAGCDALRRG